MTGPSNPDLTKIKLDLFLIKTLQIFFSSGSVDSAFVFVWSPLRTVNVIFIDTSLTVMVFFANLEFSLAPEVV